MYGVLLAKARVRREIDARLQGPGREPLNFVTGCGLPIASRALLHAVGDDLTSRELFLGRVYGPNDEELSGWATFRGRQRLVVRGSKNVSHRRCTECGRDVYFAMGKRYLYPAPPKGLSIFESDRFGLILTEEVFNRADIQRSRRFRIDKLLVQNSPTDGLAELVYP